MTTYYIDGVNGNDANAGTAEGAGNAWATFGKACAAPVAAGDIVYIKNNATYAGGVTSTIAGTSAAFIRYIGYATTPGDGGVATISGGSNVYSHNSTTHVYTAFYNLIFTGATVADGIAAPSTDSLNFYNCGFTSNAGDGAVVDQVCTFINCLVENNGGWGIYCDATSQIHNSIIRNNTTEAVTCFGGFRAFDNNVVYGNGGTYAVKCSSGGCYNMVNNTIDANGVAVGLDIEGMFNAQITVFDNIIYNATTGVAFPTIVQRLNCQNRVWNNAILGCSAPYSGIDYTDYMHLLHNNITTGTPDFTDSGNGDYTLLDTSAAYQTGSQVGAW